MNYCDIDEQIREDASYDDYDWKKQNRKAKRERKVLPIKVVYPDRVEVRGVAK
jgi:hypothetical protein